MRSRLIRIGNSRGLRLPKPVIEEAGLQGEVELQVRGNTVIISSHKRPRAGWEDAALLMSNRGADDLLDEPTPTRFDEEEWHWR